MRKTILVALLLAACGQQPGTTTSTTTTTTTTTTTVSTPVAATTTPTPEGLPGAGVASAATNPFPGDKAAIDTGKEIFAINCASCHGEDGRGMGAAGAAYDPPPRDLTSKAEYKHGTDDKSVYRTVRFGSPGTAMIGWEGRMDDTQIWQVTNYVLSLQKT